MAPSRKMKRGKMSRRVRRGKKSTRRVRRQRGGAVISFNLKITQAVPATRTTKAVQGGAISLVGTAPPEITGLSVSSAVISFTTPTPVSALEAIVNRKDGTTTSVNIPVSVSPTVGTGTTIRADVNGNNVKIYNVSSGNCCLKMISGDPGTFIINVTTAAAPPLAA